MPIYEYRCGSCGAELEKLQKISDPPLLQCPECGKDSLVKLVSASSFRLKGSGWYETDFKTGKKKNGAGDAPDDGAAKASTDGAASSGGASSAAPESAKEPSKSSAEGAAADSKAKEGGRKESKSDGTKEATKSSDGAGKTSKPAPKA